VDVLYTVHVREREREMACVVWLANMLRSGTQALRRANAPGFRAGSSRISQYLGRNWNILTSVNT
jgi:hypothetical protein